MKKILVTGSIAYDHIMSYDGRFKDVLLGDSLDKLSVSFIAKEHEFFFGGCATNIAYNLNLLKVDPCIFAVAGNDFSRYKSWLDSIGISSEFVAIDDSSPTAVATILSDNDSSQFVIFSPGANKSPVDLALLSKLDFSSYSCAILGPEWPDRMIALGEQFVRVGLPFIFDPGQALHALSAKDLSVLAKSSIGMILNDYEADLWEKISGIDLLTLSSEIFVVKTTGENGCDLFVNGAVLNVPTLPGFDLCDITGCGDAFRAGFLAAYSGNCASDSLELCCKWGHCAASFALSVKGTQKHSYAFEEFNERLALFV